MNFKYEKKNLNNNNISYSDKNISKKIPNLNKSRSISSKNIFPHDSSYTIKTNQKKNNNNEENVIANILKTNNIQNDDLNNAKENDKININVKFSNKALSTSINFANDYKEIGDFSYINISEKIKPFLYKSQKMQELNTFHFLDKDSTYRMVINILVDDDSLHSSNNLLNIFESIFLSLNSLGEINILNKDFLVCIFFQHFSCEETFKSIFPGLSFYNCNNWNLKMNAFYCSYGEVLSVNDTPINALSFYKESSTFIEVNKFFYCNILNDLITLININPNEIGKTFLVVNWPNGKIYEKSINKYHRSRILSNIFRITNNRNMILIPDINYHPYKNNDYFGYLLKYNFDSDKIYVNLMWEMMTSYPIDHRLFFINMNYALYSVIKEYYQNNIISIYSNEYYFDYNFSIYLKLKMKNITIEKIQHVKFEYSDLSFNLIDFFYELSLKRGSEYANFFALFSYFFYCNNMTCYKFFKKITIIFKLLTFFIEFFWLGLSLLVSYAVFNETFGSKGNKMDYFCSVGYAIIAIILILFSSIFIKNKPKIKRNKINRNISRNKDSYTILIVLYIIHYVYNIFFIVCAIIAVIHVDEGRNKREGNYDYYIFKKKYFFLLLILIILFIILPSLIRPTNLTSKGFLYYLIFHFLNSTCFFHLPYLFTCIRNINSSKRNYEALYVSLYALLNGILTTICLIFDTKRRRRMDFFYTVVSIIAILTGVRMIILIIGICLQNKFNRKISSGEIPQYNIEKNEFDNNINNNKLNNNIFINNNDDLKLNKNINDSHLAIKSIYEKQNLEENADMKLKDRNGTFKESSSQADILPNLLLNESFEKEFKKKGIYCLKSDINITQKYPIIKLDENEQNQIKYIPNKANNENNNDNNNCTTPQKKELSINNKKENENKNNKDLEGIYYPFDTTNNNDYSNNSISDNYNYNKKYVMEEIKNPPQNEQKNFVLDQNDIFNNENSFINQSQLEKINNNDESNY